MPMTITVSLSLFEHALTGRDGRQDAMLEGKDPHPPYLRDSTNPLSSLIAFKLERTARVPLTATDLKYTCVH